MPRTTKLKRTRNRVHVAACGAYCDFFGGDPDSVKGTTLLQYGCKAIPRIAARRLNIDPAALPEMGLNHTVADLIGHCMKAVLEGAARQ